MELQEIDVFIEPDGRVRIEVRGMKGQGCLAETRELERILGGQILEREMTAEANDVQDDAESRESQRDG